MEEKKSLFSSSSGAMKRGKREEWGRNWASFQRGRFNFATWFSIKNCRSMRKRSWGCNPNGLLAPWVTSNNQLNLCVLQSMEIGKKQAQALCCNLPKWKQKKANPSSIPAIKTKATARTFFLLPSSVLHFSQVNIQNKRETVNVLEKSVFAESKSENEAANKSECCLL